MRSVFRHNLDTRKMSFPSTFHILSLAYSLPYFSSISLRLPQAIDTFPNPVPVLIFPLQCTQFDIADYQKLYILTSALSSGTAAGRWRKLYIILHMGNYVKQSEELYCQENVCSRSFSCHRASSFCDKDALRQFFGTDIDILNQKSVGSI